MNFFVTLLLAYVLALTTACQTTKPQAPAPKTGVEDADGSESPTCETILREWGDGLRREGWRLVDVVEEGGYHTGIYVKDASDGGIRSANLIISMLNIPEHASWPSEKATLCFHHGVFFNAALLKKI